MKYACVTSVVLSLVFSSSVSADVTYYAPGAEAWFAQANPKPVPSPQQHVHITGVNAEGKKQGTIVDQNGNLKVIDSESVEPQPVPPATSQMAPAQPIPNQTGQSMPPQPQELQPVSPQAEELQFQGQPLPQQPGAPEVKVVQESTAVNNIPQPAHGVNEAQSSAQPGREPPMSVPVPPEQIVTPKQ